MFPELENYLRDLGHSVKGKPTRDVQATYALGAVLTGASILFHTGNDNKDADTRLRVLIVKKGEKPTADSGPIYGEYDDHSEHRVQLQPDFNLMMKSEIPGSVVRVGIAPSGNDRWVFEQVPVQLYFSDGSFYQKSFSFATLTQDTPEQDFAL